MRRIKTKRALLYEAISRGITSLGGLSRAVYKRPPLEKGTRIRASKLRHQIFGNKKNIKK